VQSAPTATPPTPHQETGNKQHHQAAAAGLVAADFSNAAGSLAACEVAVLLHATAAALRVVADPLAALQALGNQNVPAAAVEPALALRRQRRWMQMQAGCQLGTMLPLLGRLQALTHPAHDPKHRLVSRGPSFEATCVRGGCYFKWSIAGADNVCVQLRQQHGCAACN
jgi:hypothetical protein